MATTTSWIQRRLLPGLAFKAVVIGGGYATGLELVTFFLPSGPVGGIYAMLLATLIWSVVCAVTFLFAFHTGSRDYRTFFRHLLGRFWPVYEIAYLLALVLILAVFAAAAGAIGKSVFGLPELAGALALMFLIALVSAWGNASVERLFAYVSFLLYATYAVFLVLSLTQFGDRIGAAFASDAPTTGWALGGLTYAGYNIIGAIVILPVTRHMLSARDAVTAGLLAGPLAMLPALLFFVCMVAYYPAVQSEALPSDFLLEQLELPWFRILFQIMIFSALLESGTGGVHAINERLSEAYKAKSNRELGRAMRFATTATLLTGSVFVAGSFGLVALIADGYRWLAYLFLLIYVVPLLTIGLWRLREGLNRTSDTRDLEAGSLPAAAETRRGRK
ncbi:YkvI family membrane protein [Sphingopyxis sp. MSC1_008]|jgi:uncharacterized membrane protein YkvI|uniref:YkvI family membrane protein n=1 Tax=Sphingopyxis sp. MSC1_008 TaxID=2909265 RepID=UPI0020BE10A6|nr:hypothetical protein [Sphingopyxis sp. MSC1_008]